MKPKSIKFAGMTIHEANQHLLSRLKKIYDDGEAMSIADMVMEKITGTSRASRQLSQKEPLSGESVSDLENYIKDLSSGRPVQYVLQEAWFAGMKFYVDESVLIPRPETEELVEWIVEHVKRSGKDNPSIIDIGTGSGCIAVAVKKKLPVATVTAIDLSEGALTIAQINARENNAHIGFMLTDILDENNWSRLPQVNIVVSNPPYVPKEDKASMHDNVVKFEPHEALFVPGGDPLIFYRALARFTKKKGQMIFAEISDRFPEKTKELFGKEGFSETVVRRDINNNPRMIFARL